MIVSPGINLNDSFLSVIYIFLQLCILTCAYRVLHLHYSAKRKFKFTYGYSNDKRHHFLINNYTLFLVEILW